MKLYTPSRSPARSHFRALLALLLLVSNPLRADYEDGVNAALSGDYDLAFTEFSMAAEQGLDLAQYNLAILYFTGRGVEKDLQQAFHWTRAAAEQGHLDAQVNLGSLYLDGAGIKQDIAAGVDWTARAAKAGHAEAAWVLANMYLDGHMVDRDLVLAHAWASQAERHEHAEASALIKRIAAQLNNEQLSQARREFARWQIE